MNKTSTLSLLFAALTISTIASAAISITNLPNSEITKGKSIVLTATGGATGNYLWYTSNPAIATINSTTGLLTGVDTGAVTISVADGPDSTSQVVFVRAFKMWLPTVSIHAHDTISVPIYVSDLTGLNLVSTDIQIQFDFTYLRLVSVQNAGTLNQNSLVSDTVSFVQLNEVLKIAVASGNPIEGPDSVFLILKFRSADSSHVYTNSPLTLQSVIANDFQLSVELQSGLVNFLNDPPVFTTVMPDTTISEGDTLHFTFAAVDPNGTAPYFDLLGTIPSGMYIDYISGYLFWQTGYADSGTYNIQVKTFDDWGDSTLYPFKLHVLNVNRPPYFTTLPPSTLSTKEGLKDSLHVTAVDPDADPITFSLSSTPAGLIINSSTGMLSWSPTFFDSGTYPVTVRIVDGVGGKDSATFTYAVADSNRPPVLSVVPHDTTINEGQSYTAQLTAIDPDLDSVRYHIVSSPLPGYSLDSVTGAITWTPNYSSAGVYTVTINISDGKPYGSFNHSYLLTVLDVNRPPTLTHSFPDTLFGSENNRITFNFIATDPDGDSLFFVLVDTGLGMTMDSVTGLWEWTPTYFQAGQYHVKIKVQDVKGGSTIDSVFVIIANVNRAPVFVSFVSTASVNEGDTLLIPYVAQDPDSNSFHYFLAATSPGMGIDSLTGSFKWIPNYFQGGTSYPISVGVTDGMDTTLVGTTIVVVNVNLPPIFTSTLHDTAIARFDTLKFRYSGYDRDSGSYSIYLHDTLSGASIDTNHWFTWIPPAWANGTYKVVMAISDGFLQVLDTALVRINIYGDVSGNGYVGSYDASLILQDGVGRISLTPLQKIIGNVSGDTTISALDASLILQYSVGIISTFPGGLGKYASPEATLAPFSFRVEKGATVGDFDLVISLTQASQVYGITSSILFDTSLVKPKTLKKESLTDSMAFSYFFPSGKANFSLAGVKPLTTIGDIARFSFTLKDLSHSPDEILFTVGKFVLNEMDFTNAVPGITLNVKQVFNIPTIFALNQNYPNPFNPVTTISYQLPKQSMVTIKIYNMIGQEVRTLTNSEQNAGYYDVQWDGTTDDHKIVSTGVYLYRIEARSEDKSPFISIKKMILMK